MLACRASLAPSRFQVMTKGTDHEGVCGCVGTCYQGEDGYSCNCHESKPVAVDEAKVGDMVAEESLPESVRKEGGGWVGARYVCWGAHKDGRHGWQCIEVRRPFWAGGSK